MKLILPFIFLVSIFTACNSNTESESKNELANIKNKAEFFLDENILDSAQHYFFLMSEKFPENPAGTYGVAYTLMQQKNYEQAVQQFTKVIERTPEYRNVIYNRAYSYFILKEYEKIYINDPDMALSNKTTERNVSTFHSYREAAVGANEGKTGGGCGCN